MSMLVNCLDAATAQFLSPLFGGSRVNAKVADLARRLTMPCKSIADILRWLGRGPARRKPTAKPTLSPELEVSAATDGQIKESKIAERVDPPVSFGPPLWIDPDRIRASIARDVVERNNDDRTYAMKSALGSHFAAVVRAVHKTKRIVKPKAPPKPKAKKERTPELKEYFRNYGRTWRARKKAEMADAQ